MSWALRIYQDHQFLAGAAVEWQGDDSTQGIGVLIATAIVVGVTALITEPLTSVPLGVIGGLTVTGFSRPPHAARRKLEPEPSRPRYLLTEPGMGYRFQD